MNAREHAKVWLGAAQHMRKAVDESDIGAQASATVNIMTAFAAAVAASYFEQADAEDKEPTQ